MRCEGESDGETSNLDKFFELGHISILLKNHRQVAQVVV